MNRIFGVVKLAIASCTQGTCGKRITFLLTTVKKQSAATLVKAGGAPTNQFTKPDQLIVNTN